MNSAEYQITIKSANQKVDDYVLDCKSTWTVLRLKQYISETHINKPKSEDQRLIYAGNLLKDSLTLKQVFFRDSLCTELTNSSKTDFTIHLVCSANQLRPASSQSSNTAKSSDRSQGTSGSNAPASSNSSLASEQQPTTSNISNSNTSNQQQSNTATIPSNTQTVDAPQINQINHTQAAELAMNLLQSDHMRQQTAIFNQLANLVAAKLVENLANESMLDANRTSIETDQVNQILNNSPLFDGLTRNEAITSAIISQNVNHLVASSVASQDLYAGNRVSNQGVDQAGQNLNNADLANGPRIMINHPANGLQIGEHQGPRVEVAAPAVIAPRAVPQAQPAPIGPQPIDPDVPGMQHDVIDWVYYFLRAMVLFLALYIHASVLRLMFIALLLAIAYFFNRRSARRAARNNLPERDQVPRDNQDGLAEMNGNVINDGEHQGEELNGGLRRRRAADENVNIGEDEVDNVPDDTRRGPTQQPQDAAQRRVSMLKLCYLVVTDFLASLVPE